MFSICGRRSSPRITEYEKAPTDMRSKTVALGAVDKFFTLLIRNGANSPSKPGESLKKNYIKEIFEKINEIKIASSGWVGVGRKNNDDLSKLRKDLDSLILGAYNEGFGVDERKKLCDYHKPQVNTRCSEYSTEEMPLMGASTRIFTEEHTASGVRWLCDFFDTIMRNDSRVFQVTIPQALATLFGKYNDPQWNTKFIARNIKIAGKEKYELKDLNPITDKKYQNPYLERVINTERDTDGNTELKFTYKLRNPKTNEIIELATKHRDNNGELLYTMKRLGKGGFGKVYRYQDSRTTDGGSYDEYVKKKSLEELYNERLLPRMAHYTVCLEFKLREKRLDNAVYLNHPIGRNKALARIARGSPVVKEVTSEGGPWSSPVKFFAARFMGMLQITTQLHECGAFGIDNKPENYMLGDDDKLKRVDLDFDAKVAATLDSRLEICGNPTECPFFNQSNQSVMYGDIMVCGEYGGTDNGTKRADFYRGQSLAGLVLSNIPNKEFDDAVRPAISRDGKSVANPRQYADLLKEKLLSVLPADVRPHTRDNLINFVVNWHCNQKHGAIVEFLVAYRLENKLMDPRMHLSDRGGWRTLK